MRNLKIEIVIPVYNRRELTLQCLRSLARIDQTGLETHIIVVDDGSSDGTGEAVAADFPAVEIIRGTSDWWWGGASNRGLERALTKNPDYILLLNDDTVQDDKFLQHLVRCAENHQRAVIGGLLLLWNTPHKVFQVAPQWDTWYGGWRHLQQQTVWTIPGEPFEVDAIAGNCILFPAEVFREQGFLNEKLFPQYADAEFTPRIKKKGWRLLIEPRARIFNEPNTISSLGKMSWKQMYRALWGDLRRPQNIRTHFLINWVGAPSKPQALAAGLAYTFRVFARPLGLIKNGANGNAPEKPLTEIVNAQNI